MCPPNDGSSQDNVRVEDRPWIGRRLYDSFNRGCREHPFLATGGAVIAAKPALSLGARIVDGVRTSARSVLSGREATRVVVDEATAATKAAVRRSRGVRLIGV